MDLAADADCALSALPQGGAQITHRDPVQPLLARYRGKLRVLNQ